MEALTSSERVHPEYSRRNNSRSEDYRHVSQRIRRSLRQFCQSLLYIAAMKLCRANAIVRHEAGPSDGTGVSRLAWRYDDKTLSNAFTTFSKILSSLPAKDTHVNSLSAIDVFVSKLREEVQEFCARDSKAEKKPFVPRFGRRDKVSRSPGLENLTVTLNLARGDLEVSFAF